MKKGISPLVATVLLISFTMAVAIILINWLLDYSRARTTELNERGSQQVTCSGAWLEGSDATYNTTLKRLSLDVWNKGNVPLSNLKLFIIFNNGTSGNYLINPENITLSAGDSITIYNVSVDSSLIKRVRVSHNCSGANAASGVTVESDKITIR